MPQVSVLMTIYNGSTYLDEQLRSIIGQTHSDFELLIYDDGSTDGSWDIIERFSSRDQRIGCIRSQNNDGQGFALGRLFEVSKSNKIMFADQDDVWAPDKIGELVRAIDGHSLAYGVSKLIDEQGRDLDQTIFDFVGNPITGKNRVDLFFANTVSGHAMLVEREALDSMIFRLNSSYDRNTALAASLINGVAYAPQSVTYHRIHSANQFNSTITGKRKLASSNRPERASRHEQLLRLVMTLRCLSGMPAILPDSRNVLREMARVVQERLAEFRSLYYTNNAFHQKLMALAAQLSDDEVALEVFRKKSLRLARGSLYPTFR